MTQPAYWGLLSVLPQGDHLSLNVMKRASDWVLFFALVSGAMTTGGVYLSSYALMELAIFSVLLLVLLKQIKAGKIDLPFTPVLGLVVLFIALQIIPFPPVLVRALSPERWLHLSVISLVGENPWVPLSVNPHATQVAFIKILAYIAAFSLAAYGFDSQRHRGGLVVFLVVLGLSEAV